MKPAPRTAAPYNPAKDLRAMLVWALASRERTLRYGWARVNADAVRRCMGELRTWLEQNPAPSIAALHRYYAANAAAIHYVMPSNAAGRAKLMRMRTILAQTENQ